jgi:hypothetical protein
MFGEEVIIKKIVEELDKRYRGERNSLEDAKRSLLEIKLSLIKITLHRRFCTSDDDEGMKKLSSYMQDDIDRIHTLVFKARTVAGMRLHKDLSSFIETVLKYNERINASSRDDVAIRKMGESIDERVSLISKGIELRIKKLEAPFLKKKQKEIKKMIPKDILLLGKAEKEIPIFGGKEKAPETEDSTVVSGEED